MPRLIPCSACHAHVQPHERRCPHCGTALRTTFAPRASAVLLGLALAGCPGDDDTNDETGAGSSGGTTATTSGDTEGATSVGSGETTAAPTSSSSIGEPEYGVPDTGIDGSGTSSGTDGSSSSGVGEPEYGVPETTTG